MESYVVALESAFEGIGKRSLVKGFELFSQGNEFACEAFDFFGIGGWRPIDPGDFVVLAEAVIVAFLRSPALVSAQ